MQNSEPDQRIQAELSGIAEPRSDSPGLPQYEDALRGYRTRVAGTLFGALAGMPLGALAVSVFYWFADYGDYAWEGSLYGAVCGTFGGALIGFIERTIRGDLAKADVATCIGGVFGLAIAPLTLLGTGGGTVYVLTGISCAGPMAGLLFGAVLDRAYDECLQRHWPTAICGASFGNAACFGIVFLIVNYSDPDPNEVAKDAWKLISDDWQRGPELKDAKIRKITLDRPEHRTYIGTMDTSMAGKAQRFDLEVYVRHNKIKAKWVPRN